MTIATVLCTKDEAQRLTRRIVAGLDKVDGELGKAVAYIEREILPLIVEAKDREAWRALGYKSWEQYVTQRFGISRRLSYRLLDRARAEALLSEAVDAPVTMRERTLRPVRDQLPAIGQRARAHRARGMDPQAAVDTAVNEARRTPNDGAATARKRGGMSGGDPIVRRFMAIAKAFESLTELDEQEATEPEAMARSLDAERRRAIERAIERATQFVDRWVLILGIE